MLVIFTTSPFDPAALTATLDGDYRENLRPDGVVVIVPDKRAQEYQSGLRTLAESQSILRFDASSSPLLVLPFDHAGAPGSLIIAAGDVPPKRSPSLSELKQAGLDEIFLKRDVLVRPGPTLHFVHPNGSHSRGFLRAANALVKGPEVKFMAMALLPYIATDPRRIWIDSSSIASIAYALVSLKQEMNPSYMPPPIESFSSYDGIESTYFEHPEASFFLISANATGRLARQLIDKHGLLPRQVVTLFSAVADRGNLEVLCDVGREAKGLEGVRSSMKVSSPKDCPHCRDGSPLIQFVGDQFLANAISYRELLIVANHAPRTLAPTMDRLARKRLFKLRSTRSNSDVHSLWIDAKALLNDGDAAAALEGLVRRYVPGALSHVVHLEDPGSQALGVAVVEIITGLGMPEPKLVARNEISKIDAAKANSAAIVAGCIGSGSSLQAVSRDLRDILKEKARIYIGITAKHAETEKHKSFKSDLVYNSEGHKHGFEFIHELWLPRPGSLTAWMKERAFVADILDSEQLLSASDAERAYFEQRLDTLSGEQIGDHDFFLPAANGQELRLREGFAFWKNRSADGADQGDVLATIGSVLHHLRTSRDGAQPEPRISKTEFHCTVLSPSVFGRYNDGVIQAAFLRLAYPHELNFSSRPDLSADMTRIIERCLERAFDSQGEACAEFLMALAMRRLTLAPVDLERLRRCEAAKLLPPPEWRLFEFGTKNL